MIRKPAKERAKLFTLSALSAAVTLTGLGMQQAGSSFRKLLTILAIGAICVKLPLDFEEMPKYVRQSLQNRRGGFLSEELYKQIPAPVRTSRKHTVTFLKERDLSHIRSVRRYPNLENKVANVVFEKSGWNRSRGSRTMTIKDHMRLKLDNFAASLKPTLGAAGMAASRGALVGVLLELPVFAAEHFILVRSGVKTPQKASHDMIRQVSAGALSGAAGAAAFTVVTLLGVPTGPVAAPLVIVGGAMYLLSTRERIDQAMEHARTERAGAEPSRRKEVAASITPASIVNTPVLSLPDP